MITICTLRRSPSWGRAFRGFHWRWYTTNHRRKTLGMWHPHLATCETTEHNLRDRTAHRAIVHCDSTRHRTSVQRVPHKCTMV